MRLNDEEGLMSTLLPTKIAELVRIARLNCIKQQAESNQATRRTYVQDTGCSVATLSDAKYKFKISICLLEAGRALI